MSILIAILLGLVQGITEFLPISSSGHLALVSKLFGVQNDILLLSVLLHFATLFVIIFIFRKEIWYMVRNPLSKESKNVYIATIPTVLIVLFYKTCLNDFFANSKLLPFGFLATAMFLLLTYFVSGNKKEGINYNQTIKKKSAFLMGFAQGFAALPGISRSGSTICTGLLSGENREETTRFSFIMSIPIILASVSYELITERVAVSSIGIVPLIFSFITAFVVGLVFIKLMLKIMKNAKYYWFSIYLIIVSVISFFIV